MKEAYKLPSEMELMNSLLLDGEKTIARWKSFEKKFNRLAKIVKRELEYRETKDQINEMSKGKLRQATLKDYKNWLVGFSRKDSKPTHHYDYPMERGIDAWRVAFRNFQIIPLFGASSLNIIVLKGVKFLGGELGHNNLYFMDGFSHAGDWVPIYSDINF